MCQALSDLSTLLANTRWFMNPFRNHPNELLPCLVVYQEYRKHPHLKISSEPSTNPSNLTHTLSIDSLHKYKESHPTNLNMYSLALNIHVIALPELIPSLMFSHMLFLSLEFLVHMNSLCSSRSSCPHSTTIFHYPTLREHEKCGNFLDPSFLSSCRWRCIQLHQ